MGIGNLDIIFCFQLAQLVFYMVSLIVDGNDDFFNPNFGKSLNKISKYLDLKLNHGLVGEGEDRLGKIDSQWSHSSSITTDEDNGFHLN